MKLNLTNRIYIFNIKKSLNLLIFGSFKHKNDPTRYLISDKKIHCKNKSLEILSRFIKFYSKLWCKEGKWRLMNDKI